MFLLAGSMFAGNYHKAARLQLREAAVLMMEHTHPIAVKTSKNDGFFSNIL